MKLSRYHIPLLFLLLAAFCYAFSVFSEGRLSQKSSSLKDTKELSSKLESLVREAKADANFLLKQYSMHGVDALFDLNQAQFGLGARGKGIAYFVYSGNRLVFWSQSLDLPLDLLGADRDTLVRVQNSWYVWSSHHSNNDVVVSLVRIRTDYPYENRFLRSAFSSQLGALNDYGLSATSAEGAIPVALYGKPLFYLLPLVPKFSVFTWDSLAIAAQWCSFFLLLALLFSLPFTRLAGRYRFRMFWVIAPVVIVLRLLNLSLGWPLSTGSSLFGPEVFALSWLFPSLGDLALNAVILFAIVALAYRCFKAVVPVRRFRPYIIALLSVASAFLLLATDNLFQSLILHSTVTFEAYRIFDLSVYTLIGYIAIGLLFGSAFLLNHLWLGFCGCGKGIWGRISFSFIGIALALLLFYLMGFAVSVYGIALLLLIPIVLAWFSKKGAAYRSSHVVLFAAVISVLSVFLVSDFALQKDIEVRKVIALNLSSERDPVAEMLLKDVSQGIAKDSKINQLISNISDNEFDLYAYINEEYFSGYLKKFDFQATVCFAGSELILDNSGLKVGCEGFFSSMAAEKGTLIRGTNFYYLSNQTGRISYLGVFSVALDSLTRANLYIEMDSKLNSEFLGYPELLLEGKLASKSQMSYYSTAKYHQGRLIAQTGGFSYPLEERFSADTVNAFSYIRSSDMGHIVYRPNADNVIVLSKPKVNLFNITASFAYVLLLFFFILVVQLLIAGFPLELSVRLAGFRGKIKRVVVVIVLLSLIMVGAVTIVYSVKNFEQKNYESLNEKLLSLMVEIEHDLVDADMIHPSMAEYITFRLIRLSNVFYADINLYDTTGVLIASSRPEIFERQLLGKLMDPVAFYQMKAMQSQRLLNKERIGMLSYLSAYVPLIDDTNQTIAYVNLPYFTKQDEFKREIYSIVVVLVNIYALLILIALSVAIFVANQISRPLELIRDKLRRVDISGHNEPLYYEYDDEVGRLVKEYNRMVEALARSAEELARSQRESAWREMARQVAHEIKNPLTPIKLSLQHLTMRRKHGDPDWDKHFDKFAASLIEQINTLATIATEFSNFAKMPALKFDTVDVYRLLDEATHIFSAYKNISIAVSKQPEAVFQVKADREQLSRVFVNLLKNAVQSIPLGRKGVIRVDAYCVQRSVIIDVTDNGGGIPLDLQAKIFSPNFTTKSSGTGLGLAISKGIVEGLGGKISFQSQPGATTFTIELPVYKGDEYDREN
ncbi:MAG: hypothetical protein JW783_06915 [Bacteroidales bacterium]|nr:hypothetical protein [Bacteroidales bacterium]MBN2748159.1 hypothetical protein [Bacteroidales bacterium]